MSDGLEKFVLKGPDREVDAWFQKEGFGITPCMCPQAPHGYDPDDGHCLRCGEVGSAPHYTTTRILQYVIEDRVRESDILWAAYIVDLLIMLDHEKISRLDVASGLLNATNRMRILAAARAMGLKAPK